VIAWQTFGCNRKGTCSLRESRGRIVKSRPISRTSRVIGGLGGDQLGTRPSVEVFGGGLTDHIGSLTVIVRGGKKGRHIKIITVLHLGD